MGTIADKLSYLAGTKTAIHDAIIDAGGTIEEGTPFRDYADAINNLTGGTLSAEDLYASITADWPDILSIVENDSDNEYPCKCLMLFRNDVPELDFVKDAAVSKIKTSDGATYAADFIHTWNPLQDLNGKYRYIILYMSSNSKFQKDKRCISIAYNSAFLNGVITFSNMFYNCYSLQTIPLLDTSNGETFSNMFSSCYSLQTIPLLDTAEGSNFSNMFYNCYSLQTIPLLDTADVENFSNTFNNCYSLQTIPLLNTAKGKFFSSMFQSCYALQTIPLLDTANGTIFSSMFNNCCSLQTIPLLNTAKGSNFSNMFYNCYSLQAIPLLDTSNGSNFSSMFSSCYSLQTIPLLDTSNGETFSNMFSSCYSLQTIPLLDTASGTIFNGMFTSCYSLQTIDASLPTSHVYNYSVDIRYCEYLSKESILQIFANLPTKTGQTITIDTRTNAKLSDADRLIATDKGWALSIA